MSTPRDIETARKVWDTAVATALSLDADIDSAPAIIAAALAARTEECAGIVDERAEYLKAELAKGADAIRRASWNDRFMECRALAAAIRKGNKPPRALGTESE